MRRGLIGLGFGLGAWALLAVIRALALADGLAAGLRRSPASFWAEGVVWLLPTLVAGLAVALAVSMPSRGVDEYLARSVRMGVLLAVFAVLLTWSLVLFAAHVATVRP